MISHNGWAAPIGRFPIGGEIHYRRCYEMKFTVTKCLMIAAVGIGLVGLTGTQSGAQTLELKFAHAAPKSQVKGRSADRFAELVAKYSGGKMKVNVFPGGQLMKEKEEIRAAARGQLDIIAPFIPLYSAVDKAWNIFGQPLLFKTTQDAMKTFSGPVGQEILGNLKAKGLVGLAIWHDGPVYMFGKDAPIMSRADLKGKKMRVFPSPPLIAMMKTLGAVPVTMPSAEVILGLQQGTVSGVVTTPTFAAPSKWYESLKGMTRAPLGFGGYGVAMSQKTWDKLSAEQRGIITKAMKEVEAWNQEQALANITANEKILSDNGMKIVNISDAELASWSKDAEKVWASQVPAVKALIAKIRK